jgi:hypothetical protein
MGTPGPVHVPDSHDLIRVHRARENNLAAARHTLTAQHLAEYVGTGASTADRRR